MRKITASDLVKEQRRRFQQQKQKEQENSVTEDAKAVFRQKPYYMKQDRCGNELGGRG